MDDGDLITLSPYSSRDNSLDSFSKLHRLSQAQYLRSSTFWKKLWQFINIGLLGNINEFERYVVENEPNDCALVAKYYEITRIDLSDCSSISIDEIYLNTLHIPHPLINFMKNENNQSIDILNELKESPVLVFIHGLGGQMSQFEPLMGLLSQCLEILALDLPGFGNSKLNFNIKNYQFASLSGISVEDKQNISSSIGQMSDEDFSSDNITKLIIQFLNQKVPANKKVVLVGHSMGCVLSIKLAQKLAPNKVEGLILLAPPSLTDDIAYDPTIKKSSQPFNKFGLISKTISKFPSLINLLRVWDRLEGLDSRSVLRQIGDTSINPFNTTLYIKLRQFRWNLDIDTSILLKYIKGFQRPSYSDLIASIKNFNDNPFDKRIYEKTVLVGATEDEAVPFKGIIKIHEMLTHSFQRKVSTLIQVNKAGHGLLLCKPEFISGKILAHIENNFPQRLHLSPAWVLRVKADISGDKWGLKNEIKWLKTTPLSLNIIRHLNNDKIDYSPLLGMKTLKEGDQNHSPIILENAFYGNDSDNITYSLPKGNLIAVVDISADIPPYNPESFNIIKYYKCATVSKVVPDPGSIRKFISLIDVILKSNDVQDPLIAVHCHYGFNRTGFLICCYLIEKLGWKVEQAIEGFKVAKPPGIKHRHFIDALYVRYESQ